VTHVTGRGVQKGVIPTGRSGEPYSIDMPPEVKLETAVRSTDADWAVQIIVEAAHTGNIGDGKELLPQASITLDQAIAAGGIHRIVVSQM
jgi:nitrogen regulatory protein PII